MLVGISCAGIWSRLRIEPIITKMNAGGSNCVEIKVKAGMLDVNENRRARKWSRAEQLGRVLWSLVGPLFILSPRPLWKWRVFLLRLFGAKVGRNVHIYPDVRISMPWNISIGDNAAIGSRATLYALGPISIGAEATISQGAHLCAGTHDYRDPSMPLVKATIRVSNGVWICAEAFVGPKVEIGSMAIVGARAVVMRSVPSYDIVVGNPARSVGRRKMN